MPLAVTNDGKAAALAEWWLGNLKGIQNGAAITLGTGLGGGVIVEGKLIQGAHFQAGELSFLLNATKRSDAPENAEQPNNQGLTLQQLAGFSGSAVAMIRRSAQLLGLADLADGKAVFDAINQKSHRSGRCLQRIAENCVCHTQCSSRDRLRALRDWWWHQCPSDRGGRNRPSVSATAG